jgi:hypothetical protein
VLLAGNDHTYDISTGYYDANKGLRLASHEGEPLSRLILAGFNRDSVEAFSFRKR